MTNNFIKQVIFGAFFLTIFLLISLGIYFAFFKQPANCFDNKKNQGETGVDCGGSCAACELKTVRPLETNWVRFFPAEGMAILAAEIKNPNPNYASDNFSADFEIFDKYGKKIKHISKIGSFIYASDIKCLIEFTDIDYSEINDVKLSFSDMNWIEKNEFSKPTIQRREIVAKALNGDSEIEISGVAINENNYPLSLVRIIAFLNNPSSIKIGASKTELNDVGAYEEKQFKIAFPKNIALATSTIFDSSSADQTKTQICVEGKRSD